MSVRTARKYERLGKLPSQLKQPRTHRTRPNPFAADWPWVVAQLERDQALQAKTLFAELCRLYPGRYEPNDVVNGKVTGDVHASGHIELAAKATVHGNVHYNLIEMVMGSQVNGALLHAQPAKPEPAPLDLNKPARKGTFLPWHQDRWTSLDRDPLITLWTALDPATQANGCVQVVPASHKLGLINPSHGAGFLTKEQAATHATPDRIVYRCGRSVIRRRISRKPPEAA